MDVTFSEEQAMLRNTARRFVGNELTIDYIKAIVDREDRFTDQKWTKLSELGCNGILIPEEYGGLELTFVDLAVVLEEMGRAPLPGPFVSTVVLAGEAVRLAGSRDQKQAYLPRIASGELKGTLAWAEPGSLYDLNSIKTLYTCEKTGFLLTGTKTFVTDADVADLIICVANGPLGIGMFLVDRKAPGVHVNPLATMDRTMSFSEVTFTDVEIASGAWLNSLVSCASVLERLFNGINVAYSLDIVGGADKVLSIGVEYAKEREQFGQPIGSFQAIKHRCADILTDLEGARSIAYYAAWAQDQNMNMASVYASAAKAFCSEVYANAAKDVVQILGGIGFSWENEIHIFLKRAKCLGSLYGGASFHRERLAAELGY
ncbi:MAG: acyl-CoA/acyl-ACP dehydrogenase [Deltaproteobacteria bacterium]|nr:acyl-CoA/acyl-ACP dehydrogenase [Deltaproteobacteria bacterium]